MSKLGKSPNERVASAAAEVKSVWMTASKAVKEKSDAPKSEDASVAKADEAPEVKPAPLEMDAAAAAAKTEEAVAPKTAEAAPAPKEEAGSSSEVKLERMESESAVVWREVARTGDSVRDWVRSGLQKAFDKGKEANEKFLREMVVDTAAMAQDAEGRMVEVYHDSSTKEYKQRARTLIFNLKDPKNPHFIRAVITGQMHVLDLADMEVKAMASQEMKQQREQAAERAKMALMDEKTYKNYAGIKTEEGILKCPRCKSMKTEYIEVQTRSADEPTTKKCLCNNCDYRWKFC